MSKRFVVGLVGWNATWWVGLIIGIIQAVFFVIKKEWRFKHYLKILGYTLIITILFSVLGYIFGLLFADPSYFYVPVNIIAKKEYIRVGIIHNASYIGGFVGLLSTIILVLKQD